MYRTPVRTSQKTISLRYKDNSVNAKKNIKTPCGQNEKYVNIIAGGTVGAIITSNCMWLYVSRHIWALVKG
jgi:hypothetical protein